MIEFRNLSFSYKSEKNDIGLKNINLHIKKGQVTVLCGKSGCGKTTITRLINGLIPHYYEGKIEGDIFIDGSNMKGKALSEYSGKVGAVFQNPRSQFFSVDTTGELAFGCENMGINPQIIYQRIGETVLAFQIENLMERSLFALSGGEKQKIACASVSVMEPDIYVLDEPTSNLDVHSITELKKVVAQWKREDKTIVIAEHRLYWLTELADTFIYLEEGSIITELSKDEFIVLPIEKLQHMGLRSLNPFYYNSLPDTIIRNKTIVLENFSLLYKKKKALDIRKLTLPQNEIIGILGQNGAGKTTFAKCLCGLEKKAKGILRINEKYYGQKQRIALSYMVMQDVNHQLFAESVLDEVLLSMDGEDEKSDAKLAREILTSLNLLDKQECHPMSLSGGEKQRVAIGSAIASKKQIVVFDEPTSGLDYRHMWEVSKNLKRLQKMGKSLFIITHDPELIYSCCTYIMFINKGEVEWLEPMNENCVVKMNHFFENN